MKQTRYSVLPWVQTSRILDGLISRADLEAHREQLTRALERGLDAHEYERKSVFRRARCK